MSTTLNGFRGAKIPKNYPKLANSQPPFTDVVNEIADKRAQQMDKYILQALRPIERHITDFLINHKAKLLLKLWRRYLGITVKSSYKLELTHDGSIARQTIKVYRHGKLVRLPNVK